MQCLRAAFFLQTISPGRESLKKLTDQINRRLVYQWSRDVETSGRVRDNDFGLVYSVYIEGSQNLTKVRLSASRAQFARAMHP